MQVLWDKLWPSLLGVAVGTAIVSGTTGCQLSRSALIESESVPTQCKMELECLYLNQKSETVKVACITEHAKPCNKAISEEYCQSKADGNPQTLANCLLRLN